MLSRMARIVPGALIFPVLFLSTSCNNPVPPSNLSGVTYSISASGTHVEISPSGDQTVAAGSSATFTVTPSTGYSLLTTVGGTCPAGSWNGSNYTIGAITNNCSVSFNASINAYTVTASGTNVSISPSTVQTLSYGATQAFTVSAAAGYIVAQSVGGSCPSGNWNGSIYTTGAITGNCSVVFSTAVQPPSNLAYSSNPATYTQGTTIANNRPTYTGGAPSSFTVIPALPDGLNLDPSSGVISGTPSKASAKANYTITAKNNAGSTTVQISIAILATYQITVAATVVTVSPATTQTVLGGATQNFQVSTIYPTAMPLGISQIVGGNCPQGVWSAVTYTPVPQSGGLVTKASATYTTGSIFSNCGVSFTGGQLLTVSRSESNVAVTPATVSLISGQTASFTATISSGYVLSQTVTGTCPAGTWSGTTYTTGPIGTSCTVGFSGIPLVTATASGANLTFAPSASQTVSSGSVVAFAVTAATGYLIKTGVGGTCPGGTWAQSTYTTSVVTNCTLNFSTVAAGEMAYITTEDGLFNAGLEVHPIDPATGQMVNVVQPSSNPTGIVDSIAFSPNGQFAYEAFPEGGNYYGISVFKVDPQTGYLSNQAISTVSTICNYNPSPGPQLVMDPLGQFVQLCYPDVFAIDPNSGALSIANYNSLGVGTLIDPTGQYAFGFSLNTLLIWQRSGNQFVEPDYYIVQGAASLFTSAALVKSKYVYALDNRNSQIDTYLLNDVLSLNHLFTSPPIFSASVGQNAVAMTVDPSQRFVYVVNQADNTLSMFAINSTTGQLNATVPAKIATGNQPATFTIDPMGKFGYVANETDSTISQFALNKQTGALTTLPHPTFTLSSGASAPPTSITIWSKK